MLSAIERSRPFPLGKSLLRLHGQNPRKLSCTQTIGETLPKLSFARFRNSVKHAFRGRGVRVAPGMYEPRGIAPKEGNSSMSRTRMTGLVLALAGWLIMGNRGVLGFPDPTRQPGGGAVAPAPTTPVAEDSPPLAEGEKRLVPVPSLPDPEAVPPTVPGEVLLDRNVERAQSAQERNPLPPAVEPGVGQTAAQMPAGDADPSRTGGPFVLSAEKITMGKQSVALSVDVKSPPVVNLNKETEVQIIVRNTGLTDAHGVVVRDELPANVQFLSSEPTGTTSGSVLFWTLNTMAAGSERIIKLKVKPTAAGSFEHAATVSMVVGGKSSTRVQHPRLKVEAVATPSKVLRGQPVKIRVTLSNPGTGPARDVLLKARLSSGLKYDNGDGTLTMRKSVVEPGKPITLDSEEEQLIVDAVAGGDQIVSFEATSLDVFDVEEGKTVVAVKVIEPKLILTAVGPKERVTDTPATYTFKVENTGDAPARNVKVIARVPDGMKPMDNAVDPKPVWDKVARTFTWELGVLDPGKVVAPWFRVQTGGVGVYDIVTKVNASNSQVGKQVLTTNVLGVADIVVDVTPRHKALDVGEKTTFAIRMINNGSKDANKVAVKIELSKNLKILGFGGIDDKTLETSDPRIAVFPMIERLPASGNSERKLTILVEAIAAGQATCEVTVHHQDLETPLRAMAVTKVYNSDARR